MSMPFPQVPSAGHIAPDALDRGKYPSNQHPAPRKPRRHLLRKLAALLRRTRTN